MLSAGVKVITITLGAITAAKGVADQVLGVDNVYGMLAFAAIGVVISVAAGLEAAFGFEKRGAGLIVLAAACQKAIVEVDSEWRKKIGSAMENIDLGEAGRELIDLVDDHLSMAHSKAADLGINLTREVYELQGEDHRKQFAA